MSWCGSTAPIRVGEQRGKAGTTVLFFKQIGKNMTPAAQATSNTGVAKAEPAKNFAKDQLKAIIERIERLEEEKKTISDDVRDIYAEAKGNGYDCKALRTIIRLRKQDANERAEQETILELYMQSLGML